MVVAMMLLMEAEEQLGLLQQRFPSKSSNELHVSCFSLLGHDINLGVGWDGLGTPEWEAERGHQRLMTHTYRGSQ
jgi:hypothetical protein